MVESSIRRVNGKQIEKLEAQAFAQTLDAWPRVWMDIGTGDGKYVYRCAGEAPDVLCLGIDSAVDSLRDTSWRASRKPSRGGRANALFLWADAEQLPEVLRGRAERVSILYPWGSLLRAVSLPDEAVLSSLASLAIPDAEFSILLNYSVFEDADYLQRLGMPSLSIEDIGARLTPAYGRCGLDLQSVRLEAGPQDERSSWGRRLVLGSARRTLVLEARRIPPQNPALVSTSPVESP